MQNFAVSKHETQHEELLKQVLLLEEQLDFDQQLILELLERTDVQAGTIDNLQQALKTSRRIGAAIGILMAQLKITEDQAFDCLRVFSQNSQRKVRDIAEEVVLTGAFPAIEPTR